MHSNIYLLIVISLLAGFFMRPLNMFVFRRVVRLMRYVHNKPLILLIFFASMLSTFGVTISSIYLSLKLAGFIPLADNAPAFVVTFFIGGALWVIYAKKTNQACPVDLD